MSRRTFDIVFTLALFALYTTIALVLAGIGARIYTNTSETLADDYDQRTSVLYVAQKLRQADSSGQVRVEQLSGSDALVLSQVYGGVDCETWLYVKDGQLCELLLVQGAEPNAGVGQAIMPMLAMSVDTSRLDAGLVKLEFTLPDGEVREIDIHLRSSRSTGESR